MPKGHIGNATIAGRRIGVPDWVRASAEDANASASGSTADSNVRTNVLESSAGTRTILSNSISVAISQGRTGSAKATAEKTRVRTISDVDTGEVKGVSDIPVTETIHKIDESASDAIGDISEAVLITDAFSSEAEAKSSITDNKEVHDVDESSIKATADVPKIETVHFVEESKSEAEGSKGIVTWDAALGGIVTVGGSGVEGAEVHIIRDNDDTKVATTTTDNDGKWYTAVRGGKTTEEDPPVYSIEVWYRDGEKRDPSSTLYNSTNRPYIDTADASSSTPYDKYYYSNDK